jgi:hypothetical protein
MFELSELSEDDLINYTNQLIDYTRNYLTTEKLFNYIIND